MNKRSKLVLFMPLVIAIGVMSLPDSFNQQIKNSLAQKALCISRAIKSSPKCKPALQEPVEAWIKQKTLQATQTSMRTSMLSPFTVVNAKSDYSESAPYVIAQVLFRNPSRWNSSLWINKGYQDNPLIRKNSPVLSGDSVIGVIDYVGKKSSCVRLITDSGLSPSVRVIRNLQENKLLTCSLKIVQEWANEETQAFKSEDEKKAFLWILQNLHQNLTQSSAKTGEPEFLAKGILQGSGEPLWKADNALLKGTGFNYDFKDQHGPARDLRTGEIIDPTEEYAGSNYSHKAPKTPIVQIEDLLVTSGMDGIFPEGLKVATVHSIMPLTEGAFTYELYAKPTATDIMNLEYVTILPPQDFDLASLPKQVDFILDQLKAEN